MAKSTSVLALEISACLLGTLSTDSVFIAIACGQDGSSQVYVLQYQQAWTNR